MTSEFSRKPGIAEKFDPALVEEISRAHRTVYGGHIGSRRGRRVPPGQPSTMLCQVSFGQSRHVIFSLGTFGDDAI